MANVVLFRRKVRVVVDTIDVTGLDVQFSIKKSLKPDPNTCDLKVYNLNASHRSALEEMKTAAVMIEAGYEKGTSVLFVGTLRTAISVFEGASYVTALSSGDGEKAVRSARVNVSLKKGAKTADVIKAVAGALGVGEGNLNDAVSKLSNTGVGDLFSEGAVLSGSAAREMTNICRSAGLTWSIQDGKLQILALKTALEGEAIKLTPKTGLIDSPTVDNNGIVTVRMLLMPDVFPGRAMVLESARIKGQYRLEECTYTGDTRGTDWYIEAKGKRY